MAGTVVELMFGQGTVKVEVDPDVEVVRFIPAPSRMFGATRLQTL